MIEFTLMRAARFLRVCVHLFFLTILILSSAGFRAGPAVKVSAGAQGKLACQVLVRFRPRVAESDLQLPALPVQLTLVRRIPKIDVWVADCGDAEPGRLAAELNADGRVAWAEPNGWVYATQTDLTGPRCALAAQGCNTRRPARSSWGSSLPEVIPDDDFFAAQQENLRLIGLPNAWALTTGDAAPIAILDSGVDLDHPDLAQKIWVNTDEIPGNGLDDDGNGYVDDVQGWDFYPQPDALPDDEFGHGSLVAGIAAAETNNGKGIAGVSWQAQIMPLKVLGRTGAGSLDALAEGIVYAADNGARILNMSLGGEPAGGGSQTVDVALAYARSKGCLMVAAAGNTAGAVLYPASSPLVLAVAATDNQDLPWNFSSRGPEVDLAAPGVDIFSTYIGSAYFQVTGTSAAAPQVSGVAELVWSLHPDLPAAEVENMLKDTARDVWSPGWDSLTGWGRVDAYAAVSQAGPGPLRVYLPLISAAPPVYEVFLPLIRMN